MTRQHAYASDGCYPAEFYPGFSGGNVEPTDLTGVSPEVVKAAQSMAEVICGMAIDSQATALRRWAAAAGRLIPWAFGNKAVAAALSGNYEFRVMNVVPIQHVGVRVAADESGGRTVRLISNMGRKLTDELEWVERTDGSIQVTDAVRGVPTPKSAQAWANHLKASQDLLHDTPFPNLRVEVNPAVSFDESVSANTIAGTRLQGEPGVF